MDVLYLLYRDSVCPNCKGMVKQMSDPVLYRCNDCHNVYKIIDLGNSEKEIAIEQISTGKLK